MKTKPRTYIFKQVEGIWLDITAGDSAKSLADTLESLNIIIDDKCEFARFKNYQTEQLILYKVWEGKITIDIWHL